MSAIVRPLIFLLGRSENKSVSFETQASSFSELQLLELFQNQITIPVNLIQHFIFGNVLHLLMAQLDLKPELVTIDIQPNHGSEQIVCHLKIFATERQIKNPKNKILEITC